VGFISSFYVAGWVSLINPAGFRIFDILPVETEDESFIEQSKNGDEIDDCAQRSYYIYDNSINIGF
jgi:hypothetical protein